MKWSATFATFSALLASSLAEDLLLVDTLVGLEQQYANGLNFTTKVVTEAQWRAMSTSDFSAFKAIIIGDDFGSSDQTLIQFLIDTSSVWGPAVDGNIIIHGADQSNHDKEVLIENSIKFAASGKTPQGAQQTGFYFSLSQYYDPINASTVDALAYFGDFEVRGDLSCYDAVHIVASSPAIDTLTDDYLSNWGCSVHEAFSSYPTVGLNGFQAIAIADGVVFPGTQTFGDGHSGLPYIITRGATPAGCGNGVFEPAIGEECDDGNIIDGDGCSKSCKCESGKPKGDGTCLSANGTSPVGPTGSGFAAPSGFALSSGAAIIKPSGYFNSSRASGGASVVGQPLTAGTVATAQAPYPYVTPKPAYVTPSVASVSCIGVEIVVSVTVTELCNTIAPGSTVTSTITSAVATYQKPIYNTEIATMPCYICAMKSQNICSTSGFITATSTFCPQCTRPALATIYPCDACLGTTLTETCPWATTPTLAFEHAAAYTTYSAMVEHVTPVHTTHEAITTQGAVTTYPAKSPLCTICSLTAIFTNNAVVVTPAASPASTVIEFTGAGSKTVPGFGAMMIMVATGFFGGLVVVL